MATAPTKRRSWLLPRFSLRVLLLAVTAFAIGFPIWYRWPYEEVEKLSSPVTVTGKPIEYTRITTWQRQWGGGRLKHGPEQAIIAGLTVSLTTYRNGRKHGQYSEHLILARFGGRSIAVAPVFIERSPEPARTGQFVDDKKDGVWTETVNGQKTVTTYDHGKQVTP